MSIRIENLSIEEKRELLARVLKKKAHQPTSAPLSVYQRRLWFLDQFDPGNAVYNTGKAIRIRGKISIDTAERSLNEIIRRHESLRTTFQTNNSEPFQVISPPFSLQINMLDIENPSGKFETGSIEKVVAAELQHPFDISTGPLLRVALLRLGEEEHIAVMAMHHIISDGWSVGVLVREFVALYDSFSHGRPSPLPELPIQYRDYASWQERTLQDKALPDRASFWTQHLAGAPHIIRLPMDRQRTSTTTFKGSKKLFAISNEQSHSLKSLAGGTGTTLYMVLLAMFNTLLHRLTGQESFLVSTPVAERERPETQGLIGFLVNTLVLRADFSGNPSFIELLKRTREEVLQAFEYKELPFDKVVEAVRPERVPGVNPLVQVMCALQNAPIPSLNYPDIAITLLDIHSGISPLDLAIEFYDGPSGITGGIEYKTDLFDERTIDRLLNQFLALIESVVTRPNDRISNLSLLTQTERRQILFDWNETKKTFSALDCIHHLFEKRVEECPDHTALIFDTDHLTYADVNRRANRIAQYLIRRGVGPEIVVGVCTERSFEMIIGVLAVLKAGGAYLPLDPSYPEERLSFMMKDAHLGLLLTQQHIGKRFAECSVIPAGSSVVIMDSQTFEDGPDTNPDVGVMLDNLCYVIYTSGSTGTPKGVQVTHHGLCNLVLSQRDLLGIQSEDCVLQFSSFSFDAATSEMFLALANGATLCLASKADVISGKELASLAQKNNISVAKFPPSVLGVLTPDEFPTLRTIGSVGEDCTRDIVGRWAPGRRFFNGYGPTEVTVGASMMECSAHAREHPPIGRPFPNVQMYVLDDNLEPVPPGVTGELFIGGTGVSRGYLNRPDLTAERFLPHPHSTTSGARLYKTGDLARFLPNGMIEFIGRVDDQVKIRGVRVELGEIEETLRRHPAIDRSVVSVRKLDGEKNLTAYLILRQQATIAPDELSAFLRLQLPEYMIPTDFVMMDSFPLTPNGKVDRASLPAPDRRFRRERREFVPPRTATEELIATLWAEALGIQQVGVYDNFFELGGHSLLAMKVIISLREKLGADVPIRSLFETPTIADIARFIENQHSNTNATSPRIPHAPAGEPLPLSDSQLMLWGVDQPGVPYNTPVAVRIAGPLNRQVLEQSITEIVRRHSILRATVAIHGGQPAHIIAPPRRVTLPIRDLRSLSEKEREARAFKHIAEVADTRLDLVAGPLFNPLLIQMGDEEHILFVAIHHILFDGWSIAIFLRELAALYPTLLHGLPLPLHELTLQYTDFAYWQRKRNMDEAQLDASEYWKKQLGNPLPVLDLPADHLRAAQMHVEAHHEPFVVPAATLSALQELSKREGVTLFMTLLAAYDVLLQKYSGQNDLIVATPVANRTIPETYDLLGFFAGFVALRADLSGTLTFAEVMRRVRNVCLDAYANTDVPLQHLIKQLPLVHDPSRTPIAQAYFTFDEFPHEPVPCGGLTLDPFRFHHTFYSGFDLALAMEERGRQLEGVLIYHPELFEPATIRRMAGHFRNILQSVTTHPDLPLSSVSVLSSEERHQLLVEWNSTTASYPEKIVVHEMFEEQVRRTPDTVAVTVDDQHITYRQLNEQANQVARHVRSSGILPEQAVAVCMERSVESIVALLAVFKSGGVYLPVSPDLPRDRLAFLLADAGISTVLTQEHLSRVFEGTEAHLILADRLPPENGSLHRPPTYVEPRKAAYIIYTSGSTGTPKGVVVEHRSLGNLVTSFIKTYTPTPNDRVLQLTSTSFDASLAEILPILCVGGTLVIPHLPGSVDIDSLVSQIAEHKVTIIGAVPSILSTLRDRRGEIPTVRLILSGGEPLSYEAVRGISESTVVSNGYGPTETTVCSLFYLMSGESATHEPAWVPIGRPLMNTQVYILDAFLNPVPIGVQGELHIAGAGLARGYLNRPDLTADRFIPNPFNNAHGDRLYRTGDLARYLPDGGVEFIGRMDEQVKLRGFRIELGEVETRMRQHEGISDAVALVREDVPGDRRLVAYYRTNTGEALNTQRLRAFMQKSLPHYMIPSHFMHVDAFPLTSSGKVNRASMPQPEWQQQTLAQPYVAPRTEQETQLAAMWGEVLRAKQVGVFDDFFALGGHSLLAAQIMIRANDLFDVEVPLRAIFETPTIAGLSLAIDQARIGTPVASFVSMSMDELKAEAALDPNISISIGSTTRVRQPSVIFLTGANGFLGGHLLAELLRSTSAEIHCLVRAEDNRQGLGKIKAAMMKYDLWDERSAARIAPVVGDLTSRDLGLSEDTFSSLASNVDTIYHSAASVNLAYPYTALKAANVSGTQEVLRLAASANVKQVHYVSTLSVFSSSLGTSHPTICEHDSIEMSNQLFGGYSQSKWVAEQLATIARSRGVPVTIYRPGRVAGHSRTGTWNTDDMLCTIIKGWIQLGCIPNEELDMELDLTPVDYVSKAIVHLSLQADSPGNTFHILNPQPLTIGELVAWIRSMGYQLEPISMDDFQQRIASFALQQIQAGTSLPLPISEGMLSMEKEVFNHLLSHTPRIRFDSRRTRAGLMNSTISCPSPDEQLLHTYFSYFIRSGFLDPPTTPVNHP